MPPRARLFRRAAHRCNIGMWLLASVLATALMACGATSGPEDSSASGIVVIPGDAASCTRCEFVAETLAVLQSDEMVQLTGASQVVWLSEPNRFIVAPIQEPGRFAVYDGSGRLLQIAGKVGDGPGEHRSIRTLVALEGDSVGIVGDDGRLVVHSLAAGTAFTHHELIGYSVNDIVSLSSGWIAVNGLARDRGPVAFFRAGATSAETSVAPVTTSVAKGIPTVGPKRLLRSLSRGSRGTVWAATNQYEVELTQWDTLGILVRTLRREPSWFPLYDEAKEDAQRGLLPSQVQRLPVVNAVSEDASGRLWLLGTIHARDWQQEDPPIQGYLQYLGTDGTPRLRYREWNRFLDGVIEVIDPDSGRLIAQWIWPTGFSTFLAPGLVANLHVPESEAPEFHIFRLSLRMD